MFLLFICFVYINIGEQVASINSRSAITCALSLDERMYLATTNDGVVILDGNAKVRVKLSVCR